MLGSFSVGENTTPFQSPFAKMQGWTAPAAIAAPAADPVPARTDYNYNPTPIPYAQATQPAPNPGNAFVGGGGGGGYPGGGGAPAAPAGPSPAEIAAQQQAARKAQMDQWAHMDDDQLKGVDSTFGEQLGMYRDKLQKYVADYDAQVGNGVWGQGKNLALRGNADANGTVLGNGLRGARTGNLGGTMGAAYNTADDAIRRNADLGLRNFAEDYANRGMMNSGLYNRDYQDTRAQYGKQMDSLDQGTLGQIQNLDFNRNNFTSDNTAQIAGARRDALNRLAQTQSVV